MGCSFKILHHNILNTMQRNENDLTNGVENRICKTTKIEPPRKQKERERRKQKGMRQKKRSKTALSGGTPGPAPPCTLRLKVSDCRLPFFEGREASRIFHRVGAPNLRLPSGAVDEALPRGPPARRHPRRRRPPP